MKLFLKIFLIIISSCANSYSQIDNFSLAVTATNETCASNGALSFSVSNSLAGATILYSIYKLPNVTTPIAVTSTSPFTGLTAGDYRVVATQNIGLQTASKQQDVTIDDLVFTLTYQVSSTKVTCGSDGALVVTAITGNPAQYEIISGPVIRPLQNSNVFSNLPVGIYQIRVKDVCNENVVQTYQLESLSTQLAVTLLNPSMSGCDSVVVGINVELAEDEGVIKYPLQISMTVTTPQGTIITNSGVMNSEDTFSFQVPYYAQQPYFYSFTITDACGNSQIINGIIDNLSPSASYEIEAQDCEFKKIKFYNVSQVILVSAPAGFTTALPTTYTPQILNYALTILNLVEGNYVFNVVNLCGNSQVISFEVTIESTQPPYFYLFDRTCASSSLLIFNIEQLVLISAPITYGVVVPHDYSNLINAANYAGFNNLPVGVYVFNATDLCGVTKPLTISIYPISVAPSANVLEGCADGFGSIKVEGSMTSILLISAPASFVDYSLPHNFTSNLIANGSAFVLGNLPPGIYVFQIIDGCNTTFTITKQIFGYQDSSIATFTPSCGSFAINLTPNTNSSENTYWLQKWNNTSNTWSHPATNVTYVDGTFPDTDNSIVVNVGNNINIPYIGQFRVLKSYKAYITNTITSINCFEVIKEFDFYDQPKIISTTAVSCGTTFEVVVAAEGNGVLTYRITLKNGQPFFIQNGNSNYFGDLAPAIYNFQVEDTCGNIVNRLFEIINPLPFLIESEPILCNGQNVTFAVPNFSFLEYQWWKDNQTNSILSTSNILNIASFNSTIHNGTYYVKIVYPNNPNSCLNQTLSYTVNFQPNIPNAGTGKTVSYCGNNGTIDLFSLLEDNYDLGGSWTEITNSGTLINNLWNSSSVAAGTYQFKYRVEGSCDSFSEATVNITILPIPEIPIASVDDVICETSDIQLFAPTIANANYFWAGPNGFSSTQQNPIVINVSAANNGIYSVYVTQNNCSSAVSQVEVLVSTFPDFSLSQGCLNKEYTLTAIVPAGSNFNFNWTGPNGFSSSENPITITRGAIGQYSVTVTNQNGCSSTQSIDVAGTFCEMPNVITPNNDGANDSLDLNGFDVKKIEIYNRWGRLVFDKNNYTNEWYGQSNNGEKLPDGTYFYLITHSNLETINGWIFVNGN